MLITENRLSKTENKKNEKVFKFLHDDLGKSEGESFLTEIHFVYNEINIATKTLKNGQKENRSAHHFKFSFSDYIIAQPYGNTLHFTMELSISIIHFTINRSNCCRKYCSFKTF